MNEDLFPIENGDIPASYVIIYQRGPLISWVPGDISQMSFLFNLRWSPSWWMPWQSFPRPASTQLLGSGWNGRCKVKVPSLKLTQHLKIGHPERKFIFPPPIFRGYVSFREGNFCGGCLCCDLCFMSYLFFDTWWVYETNISETTRFKKALLFM